MLRDFAILTALCIAAGQAFSATTTAATPDEQAIRATITDFANAENKSDGERLSSLFTSDGDVYVNSKLEAKGRDAIKKLAVPKLPWSEQGPPIYKVETVRFLDPRIAIVDATRTVYSSVMTRQSHALFLLQKEDTYWRIASYRNLHLVEGFSFRPLSGAQKP